MLKQHRDVTFLIVGGTGGAEYSRADRTIGPDGVGAYVGISEDLLDVFRSLDLFVIPTVEGDTIPQVLMQALAVGLPVVSTTTGSIPDVIRTVTRACSCRLVMSPHWPGDRASCAGCPRSAMRWGAVAASGSYRPIPSTAWWMSWNGSIDRS